MQPADLRHWLLAVCLPLWLEHGVDWRGRAFLEELHPADLASRAGFRRLRVAARQTYVFARAADLGVPRAAEARDIGLEWLRSVRQDDGSYASRTDLAGAVIDPVRDLYDLAFTLFAFAHAGARDDAMALMAYLDPSFRHPRGGWRESLPDALPRRQNPHMHLLEAVLTAHAAFGEAVFLDAANGLVELVLSRLFQMAEGALPEYFSETLVPVREAGCFRMEPGHHHEWVWLLDWHGRVTGRDNASIARALMDFAERHGVDAAGDIAGELWSDGRPASDSVRIWPYTERLKALAVTGDPRLAAGCAALARCLDHPVPGLWHERRGPAGFVPGAAPASSLYHITCAILTLDPGA